MDGDEAIVLAADENMDDWEEDENSDDDEEEEEDLSPWPLIAAARSGDLTTVQRLLETGADKNETTRRGRTAIFHAARKGLLEIILLGADRDKAAIAGRTPLHWAAQNGYLSITKLLMAYGADLNARTNNGNLPIDMGYRNTEEIRQAIRDEPRRRMDHGHKRATEQDRHPNAAISPSTQKEGDEEEEEPTSKKPRIEKGTEATEGKVAEEDEGSEPSSDEEDR